MKITTGRVPTPVLRQLVELTTRDLDRIEQALSVLLVALTANDRRSVPRTRTGFPAAARVLANVLSTRPDITGLVGYRSEDVIQDLDNVALIAPLLPRLNAMTQRIEDARLLWLAEAQEPTFAAYGVAKVRAERDGSIAAMIEPLKRVLAVGPSKRQAVRESDESEAE